MIQLHDFGYDRDALAVQISELLVATADGADHAIDTAVPEVLKLLREKLQMDVVFVSEFTDGKRVFREVEALPENQVINVGDSGPLEESYCQRVVDGRLPELVRNAADYKVSADLPDAPFPVGAHLSTPIVLSDGSVYGTLCCFSFKPNDALQHGDLKNLRLSAQLAARKIEQHSKRIQDLARAEMTQKWGKPTLH